MARNLKLTNTASRIDSGSGVNYCSGGVCPEWNEADLFKRINGTANGTTSGNGSSTHADTDIFVDSSQYDYLKSGDENGTNDGIGNEWYQLIEDHNWMYGDTITGYSDSATYNGNTMYKIEIGQTSTTHYTSSTTETYTWSKSIPAKISLMYIHDYIYAYPAGIPGSNSNAENSWIFFQKDGYNSSRYEEWFSTRWGLNTVGVSIVFARIVNFGGEISRERLNDSESVRPVFYLSSKVKINEGDGTKNSPFVLGLTEDSF